MFCPLCKQFYKMNEWCGCPVRFCPDRLSRYTPQPNETPLEYREAFDEYEREYE